MLIHCCILLDFLCELYYDARIHEQKIIIITIIIDSVTVIGTHLLGNLDLSQTVGGICGFSADTCR